MVKVYTDMQLGKEAEVCKRPCIEKVHTVMPTYVATNYRNITNEGIPLYFSFTNNQVIAQNEINLIKSMIRRIFL